MCKIIYEQINPSNCRAYRLCKGDVLYFNTAMMQTIGYSYELELGQKIRLYPEPNSIIAKGIVLLVTEVHKIKKYPNKKWWQFWLKQETYIKGYNLEVLETGENGGN